ncbi:CRISPR-associated endonuclease Cas3'' [Hymenobacter rubripertinctus]|uniref:CRISPR-associated endonuclease Cas3 n=1 Tax=Hymenobacter rubripertinctus TaxID=2029981 RepID=A0A418QJ02_9BACT|nr:CRISPR-associated endonuclease Cas3'' [Hymenobacter rubripertinctus]RIY05132.1 CRISPR-associated endonuclease Cas3'' [Hymenobacter rubripertinctus]
MSLPTFAQLLATLPPLVLTNAPAYHGHSAYNDSVAPELLAEHMHRVMLYFGRLVVAHGLDAVADKLARDTVAGSVPPTEQTRAAGQVKRLLIQAVWHHDFGKVNSAYQVHIQNPQQPAFLAVKHGYGSQHAIISTYLFVVRELAAILVQEPETTQEALAAVLLALAYPVERHHNSRLGGNLAQGNTSLESPAQVLQAYLPLFGSIVAAEDHAFIHDLIGSGHDQTLNHLRQPQQPAFALYALVRLTFSLLTASDFYGTAHYYRGWDDAHPYDDFGLITDELREKIIHHARTLQPYNRQVTEHLANWLAEDPTQAAWQVPNADNLNRLRSRMAAEVVTNVRQHAHERLFYLHAPTGGGKTNLSMLAAAELLAANPELTKIYYVFPFTTLITQTAQALRETLGLTGDEVVQLHSRAAYQENEADAEQDARYGREHRSELDNLFVNFPVCLLTHVRFVDILKTSRKEANYLLHRLANSVVILDELQSYDPRHWDKLAWLFEEYARAFNIRFVLMSATLPRLSDLKIGTESYVRVPFQELLPEARQRFFLNPNFGQRVRFDFGLETQLTTPDRKDEEAREAYLTALARYVRDRSEVWATEHNGQVRTVIEFIFKKTATEFQRLISDRDLLPGYTLLVLSGTILEARRRAIIHFLKNQPATCPKVLLITTQVVEAGVDIDMDLGFKDRSLLDSEEQLAGRVNRNATKTGSVLYLFRLDSAKLLYGHDKRYGVQESRAFRNEAAEILASKNFDKLYGEVMRGIDTWNTKVGGVNLGTYQEHCRRLNFPAVDNELKLIDQENGTVFVPCEIGLYPDIWVDGNWRQPSSGDFSSVEAWDYFASRNRLLTPAQEAFLRGKYIVPIKGLISGQQVLELFENLIKKPGKSRDAKQESRKNLKQLQGILAMFTCSLFAQSKDMQRIKTSIHAREVFGLWVLDPHDWREVYDPESGIRSDKLAVDEFTVIL